MTWHPGQTNTVREGSSLSLNSAKFKFYGESSHAGGNPEGGRSALDAVELMDVGVNFMREHITSDARIHYVITEGGGEPNIVPDEAEVWYYIRAPERDQVDRIYDWMLDIAEGAALMTGTEMEENFLTGCSNYVANSALSARLWENMEELGGPKFTDEDRKWAKQLRENFEEERKERALKRITEHDPDFEDAPLYEDVLDTRGEKRQGYGSTEVGDVSWTVPTSQFSAACAPLGTKGHSWEMTAASGSSIGEAGMLLAAKVLATTGYDLFQDEDIVVEAKEEFDEMISEQPYDCPLPDDLEPPFDQLEHREH